MLRAVLNKSSKKHSIKQQLYGNIPLILKKHQHKMNMRGIAWEGKTNSYASDWEKERDRDR